MVTRIRKRSVPTETRMDVGDHVQVSVREGRLIVEPVSRVRGSHDLRALVARMPTDYQVQETDWGHSVGRETW